MHTLLTFPLLISCTTKSQPCTFRSLWFDDLFSLNGNNRSSLTVTIIALVCWMLNILKDHLLIVLAKNLKPSLPLRHWPIEANLLGVIYQSNVTSFGYVKMSTNGGSLVQAQNEEKRLNLSTLPTEIRQRIFEKLVESGPMRVVGYRNNTRDGFMFKDRGVDPVPVMLTCKQFCADMHHVYFRTISVSIKSAFPSSFSGDMSSFINQYFRDNVRKVTIADADEERRTRMATAFSKARVVFYEKHAYGLRKGAYYFCT